MKRTIMYGLANVSMIAAIGVFGLTACNSDDYKTSDSSTTSANSATSANSSATSAEAATTSGASTAADGTLTSPAEASTAPAGTSGSAGNLAADNSAKHFAATKKRKASVRWAPDNTVKMEKDKEGVYNRTEVMPEFPGGETALSNYVNGHLDYPQQAIDDNTTGTIKVSFVVDEHGKVSGARLANGTKLGNVLHEQALRVVNNMPAWKPGKVHGKTVKTRLELPISFQLEA